MKRKISLLFIFAALTLTQGCTGFAVVGGMLADPLLRPTGNACIDKPFEAYAAKDTMCDATINPIHPWNVNSHKGSPNNYCALEWGMVYNRIDMIQDAISNGAEPFKCDSSGHGFFTALQESESRYGNETITTYFSIFKKSHFISKKSREKICIHGITSSSAELILFCLDLGQPIDGLIFTDEPRDNFEYRNKNKTILYSASIFYLDNPNPKSANLIKLLIDQGAKIDPAINYYLTENVGILKPESVTTLRAILARQV